MKRSEQLRIINEMTKGLKTHLVTALKDGKIPESWDGHELRSLLGAVVQNRYVTKIEGKRKKDFKNHLLITPNLD